MKVKVLDWDSNFFNMKIGVIEINEAIIISSDIQNFDLLYVKQIEDKYFELECFKENFAETKVVFSKSISKSSNPLRDFIFSAFDTDVNKEQIYKLAFESGKFSRFKLDSNFQQHEFEALYKTWVDNSFNKELADAILLYKEVNEILGFITYKVIEDYATVGLLGVCDKHQGIGIGRALLTEVENELSRIQIKELRIPTQLQNKSACGFYTKLGYNIMEKTIIKDYWRL
jgi:dTDP-4-amino-4,6-dideoxy-D-galactose acyltransferase